MSKDVKLIRVTITADYWIEPLEGDPDDDLELAELEQVELYRQMLGIPGIDEETMKIRVDPAY